MTIPMQTIAPPPFGAPMAPAHPSVEAVRLLALRRSTSIKLMGPPGPDPATLDAILTIAARVPDHGKLFPFRFIVVEGDARGRAGEVLARAWRDAHPSAPAAEIENEQARFVRAPVVVAVVSRVNLQHKTPEWEQVLCAGAVGLNLLLAASACGFAGCWVTEWYAYDPQVRAAFGLDVSERFAGFHYIGTAMESPLERQRPVMADLISRF